MICDLVENEPFFILDRYFIYFPFSEQYKKGTQVLPQTQILK